MRGIHRTYRKIMIQDIDNHEVTGLDVVTAATLLNTPQGKVIGIFNEYAYLLKGSPIHSSGQLEWLQINVDETSVKVGGTQLINTLDGYSVPLPIKDDLAYATSLGRPTDQDMDTYAHVLITSPDEWDPSQVPDQLFGVPMFDACGDFNKPIIANLNNLLDAPPGDCGLYTDISSVFTANLHQSSPQEPDWNTQCPFLAWTSPSSIKDVTPPFRLPDANEVTPEMADSYVGAQVNLPIGGTTFEGTVKRRARDTNGNLQGKANINPILDTRTYEVEFPDRRTAEFSANAISEHMFTQCDPEWNQYLLLDSIIDHVVDDTAVSDQDRYVHVNGCKHHRKTTRGVKLCVGWKNGSTTWERLIDLKQSYPLELAEYAIAKGIDGTPAFSWWVPYVLRKRKRFFAVVQSWYHKRTHKFGFEIPKTMRRALEIDKDCGNTLWQDAIAKEMANVKVAFKVLPDGANDPIGHQYMDCHLIYEIKLDGFCRKPRLVAGGI